MKNKNNRLAIVGLKTKQRYPWMSSCAAIVIIFYLLAKDLIHLIPTINLPDNLFSPTFQVTFSAIFMLILVFDIQRYIRRGKQIKKNTERLKQELNNIWLTKKTLQKKAHTYSGHADKLKLFISDKLLEFIEYDEKFLHFKNIAAEVRHNGVISYDIVKTALQLAQENAHNLQTDVEQSEVAHNTSTDQQTSSIYGSALDAMRYLWDLLDLSTADNIAMHIANYLIECEEHYYQIMLNQEQGNDLYQSVPYQPDFSALLAAKKTIAPFLAEHQEDDKGDFSNPLKTDINNKLRYQDDQFRIALNSDKNLLGNDNHIRLILENLLKNAQHFSHKVPYKQKSDRISLQLSESDGAITYSIYNRGPHVSDQDKDQIFQLGYSTRRVKEHHGKGLGLFFVNEIVKGYEGHIELNNITNVADTYSVRIEFENGEIITKVIQTNIENARPMVKNSQDEQLHKSLQWQYEQRIKTVEVSSTNSPETSIIDNLDEKIITTELDPCHPHLPLWSVEIQPKRGANKTHNVKFTPLDISGIAFNVTLPTANSRMEDDDSSFSEDFEQQVEALNLHFKELDDF